MKVYLAGHIGVPREKIIIAAGSKRRLFSYFYVRQPEGDFELIVERNKEAEKNVVRSKDL